MTATQIALLRGINVGGTGKLPMADLRSILQSLGAQDVQTYIQSGNAVFSGSLRAEDISTAVEKAFGFRPRCMVLSADTLRAATRANPFEVTDPKEMHLFFLERQPQIDPDTLSPDANGVERWHLGDKVFYLYSPGGLSKSKLAARLERRLGVAATARNWNTVTKLAGMTDDDHRI